MTLQANERQIVRDALFTRFADTVGEYGALIRLQQESNSDAGLASLDEGQGKWAEAFLERLDKDEQCQRILKEWIRNEAKGQVPPLCAVLPRVFRYVYLRKEFEEDRLSQLGASQIWRNFAASCQSTLAFAKRLVGKERTMNVGALADPRIANIEGKTASR
jgi:hypothetical protein